MKKIVTTPTLALASLSLFAALMLPAPAHALSCLQPSEHIPQLVEDVETVIFSGEITAAEETDGHVTHLTIAVDEAIKGAVSKTMTVQYAYDDTWQYLCTNPPASVGTTETFMVRPGDETVPYVTYSFAADSQLKATLDAAVADGEVSGTITSTSTTPEVTDATEKRNVLLQLVDLLQQLIARLR